MVQEWTCHVHLLGMSRCCAVGAVQLGKLIHPVIVARIVDPSLFERSFLKSVCLAVGGVLDRCYPSRCRELTARDCLPQVMKQTLASMGRRVMFVTGWTTAVSVLVVLLPQVLIMLYSVRRCSLLRY